MNIQKKHYLIYLTTNLVNSKIYIGKHVTTNIEDDYFGSGNLIRAAINKYGLKNFVKTILFELLNEEEMNLLEKCVVTLEFCAREDTYNINVGGDGGWSYVNATYDYNKRKLAHHKYLDNATEEDHLFWSLRASIAQKKRIALMTLDERENFRQLNSKRAKRGFSLAFKGKHHTNETKEKIKLSHAKNPLIGNKNGMYGKHWIRNPLTKEFKLISSNEHLPNGWEYGKYLPMTDKVKKLLKIFSLSSKGKTRIYNPTTGELRWIHKNDPIPEGFEKRGRPLKEQDKQKIRDSIRQNNVKNIAPKRIEELRPMYAYYIKHGWAKFKEHFNYQYSLPNFVGLCKRYLPEYIARQGKKRGV